MLCFRNLLFSSLLTSFSFSFELSVRLCVVFRLFCRVVTAHVDCLATVPRSSRPLRCLFFSLYLLPFCFCQLSCFISFSFCTFLYLFPVYGTFFRNFIGGFFFRFLAGFSRLLEAARLAVCEVRDLLRVQKLGQETAVMSSSMGMTMTPVLPAEAAPGTTCVPSV